MKNEKSLIEVVASLPLIFHEHLDSLNMGDTVTRSPTIYRHIETGEEYVNLAGAIAWPGKELPGFILVIGVRVDPASENILYNCIDEAEDHCIENLLVKCITLRNRYGFRQSQKLFRFWYGDSIRFVSLVTQFNQQLRDDKKTERIYLANPIDFEKVNHFELYLRRTQSALMLNGTGRKTLFLGNCHRLRNSSQATMDRLCR